MKNLTHKVEFCVVGGGIAGMCAAISAARHGIKTMLIHDRPVYGGNASSEIRMWICGSPHFLETGLVEEFRLENLYRNHYPNYSVWDTILYEKIRYQENLTALMNTTCVEAAKEGNRIKSVKCWQLTTETWHTVEADMFADCSGDGILAPLAGADFRIGREAKAEFGESLGQDVADSKTMGMSCLIQARETDRPQKFTPPKWAYSYPTEESLPPLRGHDMSRLQNYWYLELGGNRDSIGDAEEVKDELLKVAMGMWDHIKNHGDHGAENYVLDWIGFLPGKRESRRLMGDYILSQKDVLEGTEFEDMVAYGGCPVDDHHPDGFEYRGGEANIHIQPDNPYGIPLRCLYSRNIDNLFFAGRNISCTHVGISSTRVMATCACVGQAAGTAAAYAVKNNMTPREVCKNFITGIQNTLMDDDCFLPGKVRPVSALCQKASLKVSCGDGEELRSGIDRAIGEKANAWVCNEGDWAEYDFGAPVDLKRVRLIFDSRLSRNKGNWHLNMIFNRSLDTADYKVDDCLVEAYHIEADGKEIFRETNNYQRLVKIPVDVKAGKLRLVIDKLRGNGPRNVFAFEAE